MNIAKNFNLKQTCTLAACTLQSKRVTDSPVAQDEVSSEFLQCLLLSILFTAFICYKLCVICAIYFCRSLSIIFSGPIIVPVCFIYCENSSKEC